MFHEEHFAKPCKKKEPANFVGSFFLGVLCIKSTIRIMEFSGITSKNNSMNDQITVPSILSIDLVHKMEKESAQDLRMTLLLGVMTWAGAKLLLMLLANMLNK